MTTAVEINGHPAGLDDLALLTGHNYGAYTFLQVRDGRARGWSLHVQRLRADADELFGLAPDERQLADWVRRAVAGRASCSVRVTTVCLDTSALTSGTAVQPDVLVEVSPPREPGPGGLRVRTVGYERETPWVKHRATHGLVRQLREARRAGYDDALLVDRTGHLTEGSTWNLAVHDGAGWVWPEGPQLPGVTMRLVQQQLTAGGTAWTQRPVHPEEPLLAAVAMNATGLRAITAVDGRAVPESTELAAHLARAWAAVPFEEL